MRKFKTLARKEAGRVAGGGPLLGLRQLCGDRAALGLDGEPPATAGRVLFKVYHGIEFRGRAIMPYILFSINKCWLDQLIWTGLVPS